MDSELVHPNDEEAPPYLQEGQGVVRAAKAWVHEEYPYQQTLKARGRSEAWSVAEQMVDDVLAKCGIDATHEGRSVLKDLARAAIVSSLLIYLFDEFYDYAHLRCAISGEKIELHDVVHTLKTNLWGGLILGRSLFCVVEAQDGDQAILASHRGPIFEWPASSLQLVERDDGKTMVSTMRNLSYPMSAYE